MRAWAIATTRRRSPSALFWYLMVGGDFYFFNYLIILCLLIKTLLFIWYFLLFTNLWCVFGPTQVNIFCVLILRLNFRFEIFLCQLGTKTYCYWRLILPASYFFRWTEGFNYLNIYLIKIFIFISNMHILFFKKNAKNSHPYEDNKIYTLLL